MISPTDAIAISGGQIKGPALTLPGHDLRLDFTPCPAGQQHNQWQRFEEALQQADQQLVRLQQQAREKLGDDIAALFAGLHLLVTDPELIDEVRQQIFNHQQRAEAAVYRVLNAQARVLARLGDDYLAERAADLKELAERLVHILQGRTPPDHILLDSPVILLAHELTPAQLTLLDSDKLLGIVTRKGGQHSHAAILARAYGIPAIAGVDAIDTVNDGDWVAIDGDAGHFYPAEPLPDYPSYHQEAVVGDAEVIPAFSPIQLAANLSTLAEARRIPASGALEVGLCRTELLFLNRQQAPSLERQTQIYQRIAQQCYPAPVTFRLLDAGGDKPLPWLSNVRESNPALGWHGIRLLLDNPQLLDVQLQALLAVASTYPLRIMIPMVAEIDEVRAVKTRLQALATEQAVLVPPLGAMIETPAAAVLADILAAEVDFFSIGSNDLAQYTLAVDRENPKVAKRLNEVSPAIIRMMHQVVSAAQAHNIPVTLCGEWAAKVAYLPLWLSLGLTGLSMQASALPAVRQWLLQPIPALDKTALLAAGSRDELAALLAKAW